MVAREQDREHDPQPEGRGRGRRRIRSRWYRSVAVAGVVAVLLAVSAGPAMAAPGRVREGYFVTDAGVFADRGGEPWYCALTGWGCGPAPVRPTGADDEPVWSGRAGWHVQIECRKGNYYLVHDGTHPSGWAVAGLAVLPVPNPDEVWGPPQCSLFDEADH